MTKVINTHWSLCFSLGIRRWKLCQHLVLSAQFYLAPVLVEQNPFYFLRDCVSSGVLEFEGVSSGARAAVRGQPGIPVYFTA